MKIWISPSSLPRIDECPRCFWLHHRGIKRPYDGVPQIFRVLDALTKDAFQEGDRLDWLGIPGKVHSKAQKVCSIDVGTPEHEARVFGEYDLLALLDDGTYCVVDFKETVPRESRVAEYGPQLNAYAFALEHPDRHQPLRVSGAGLLVFDPQSLSIGTDQMTAIQWSRLTWMDVPIDRELFSKQLREAVSLAVQPDPPPSGERCPICCYANRVMGFAASLKADRVNA